MRTEHERDGRGMRTEDERAGRLLNAQANAVALFAEGVARGVLRLAYAMPPGPRTNSCQAERSTCPLPQHDRRQNLPGPVGDQLACLPGRFQAVVRQASASAV